MKLLSLCFVLSIVLFGQVEAAKLVLGKEERTELGLSQENSNTLPRISVRAPTCFNPILGLPSGSNAPGHIFYAADNEASIYINGIPAKPIPRVTDWNLFGLAFADLKRGDVISIIAKDRGVWYGAIAAFYYKDAFYSTGKADWRAVRGFTSTIPSDWMLPNYNGCSWPLATARPNRNRFNPGKSRFFPFYTGASYVWASDAGVGDTIFLRHVVGETCL